MGGNETRGKSHQYKEEAGHAQHQGVARIHLEEQRFTEPTESERGGEPDHTANHGHPCDLAQHHALHARRVSAERHADANFFCSLRNGVREHSVEADRRE